MKTNGNPRENILIKFVNNYKLLVYIMFYLLNEEITF